MQPSFKIGTAGWSLPPAHRGLFLADGTHLQRYAGLFGAVEINSSFYRPHQPATYAKWADSVPSGFHFAVKLAKEITHGRKLRDCGPLLDAFLGQVGALGEKLGPVLVQLPPSLRFDQAVATAFLDDLRRRFDGDAVCEPRHASWFTDEVDALLSGFRIARVAADPAPVPRAAAPGGWTELTYRRLHGSPVTYYSAYDAAYLERVAEAMRTKAATSQWCIFDNTARGEAVINALGLIERLA